MASAVAIKVKGVVITSSPGPIPAARRAKWRASVPEAPRHVPCPEHRGTADPLRKMDTGANDAMHRANQGSGRGNSGRKRSARNEEQPADAADQ